MCDVAIPNKEITCVYEKEIIAYSGNVAYGKFFELKAFEMHE